MPEINRIVEDIGPSRVKVSLKDDWCHICGKRGERCFIEFFYPANAEHPEPGQRNVIPNAQYVRICDLCFDGAKDVANSCRDSQGD